MVGDAGPNTTQIVVVVCGLFATIVTTVANIVVTLRGRGRAQAAHEQLAQAAINTYNGVAEVAKVVGAPVEPLPPGGSTGVPSTSEPVAP